MTYEGDVPVVAVDGDLDLDGLPALMAVVTQLDPETTLVVLDFDAVAFVDSTGITAAVTVQERFGQVVIRNASPNVRRLFEIVGLDDLLA